MIIEIRAALKMQKERGPGFHQGLPMTTRAMPGIRPSRISFVRRPLPSPARETPPEEGADRGRTGSQRRITAWPADWLPGRSLPGLGARSARLSKRPTWLGAATAESASAVAYKRMRVNLAKLPLRAQIHANQAAAQEKSMRCGYATDPPVTAPRHPFRRCGCEPLAQDRKQKSCHHRSGPSWPRP